MVILGIVIVHYVLNWNWVKGVFKATLNGKSKPKARLMLLLDVALGVFIVINIASGILISQTILRIFEVENIVLFSSIHEIGRAHV